MNIKVIMLIALSLCMSGCWGAKFSDRPNVVRTAPRPAKIGHIVFVKLKDPSRIQFLQYDSDFMLGNIPSVSTYACGPHLDTGRETVLNDYDLAVYLGFESEQDLAAYVAHPKHIEFVEKWKPSLESLRVYDMIDQPNTPSPYGISHQCIPTRKKFLGIF